MEAVRGHSASERELERERVSESLAAIVDRLAAEFPDRARPDIERVAAESWSLFSASNEDETLRVVATEWYARTQL
jgi:hypothetical protein